MAKRTNYTKVKEILTTSLSDEAIEAYIAIATVLVDEIPSDAGVSSTLLAEIERFLTAHLIVTTKERRGIEEEVGEARIKYADVFGPGLQATEYGQMVSQLDTSGALATLGKKRINFKAITSFE